MTSAAAHQRPAIVSASAPPTDGASHGITGIALRLIDDAVWRSRESPSG